MGIRAKLYFFTVSLFVFSAIVFGYFLLRHSPYSLDVNRYVAGSVFDLGLISVSVAAGVFALVFYFLSKQIVNEVDQIKSGLHNLKYDLDYKIPQLKGELGEIAASINDMAVEMKNLYEAGIVLNSTLNTSEILRRSVDITVKVFKADICSLMLLCHETQKLTIKAWHGLSYEYVSSVSIKPGEGIAGLAFQQKKPVKSADVTKDSRVKYQHLLIGYEKIKSILSVPIFCQGEVAGTLGVYKSYNYDFTEPEINFLQSIANQIGLALENANLYKEMETLAITDRLTGAYNHKHFQEELEQEINLAQEKRTNLSLLIIDIDYFKHYNDTFGHQAGDSLLKDFSALLKTCVKKTDLVARYGGEEFTVILREVDSVTALEVAERIRSKIADHPFPGREEQPNGKITVSIGIATFPTNASSREELLKRADEALYKAKQANKNKVELYFSVLDDLKEDLNQSEHTLINTVKALITVINAKDRYTYGHSERVVQYATELAEWLGLDSEEIKFIKYGAFLHDIGKIEINRLILNKIEPLTDEEWQVLKQHPGWGTDIIKPVTSLKKTLPMIMYHHERFDGTGYPMGYKGQEIPFNARLLTIVDSFDAMTVNRSYQKAKTFEEAVEELKTWSGFQFDPDLTREFIKLLQKKYIGSGGVIIKKPELVNC